VGTNRQIIADDDAADHSKKNQACGWFDLRELAGQAAIWRHQLCLLPGKKGHFPVQPKNLFCFEQTFSSPLNSLIAGESEGLHMNRSGVEFSLTQVEPGLWKWEFQIGDTVTIGKTQSNLMGMAARRVQQRIDRELGKPRDLTCGRTPFERAAQRRGFAMRP
jgi:hypothetical protein